MRHSSHNFYGGYRVDTAVDGDEDDSFPSSKPLLRLAAFISLQSVPRTNIPLSVKTSPYLGGVVLSEKFFLLGFVSSSGGVETILLERERELRLSARSSGMMRNI